MNIYKAHKYLDIPFGTTISEINKKYRELAKKYHPDICKHCGKEMYYINEAYNTILNFYNVNYLNQSIKEYKTYLNIIDYINNYKNGYFKASDIILKYKDIFINNNKLSYFYPEKEILISIEIELQNDINKLPHYHFDYNYKNLYIVANKRDNPLLILCKYIHPDICFNQDLYFNVIIIFVQ